MNNEIKEILDKISKEKNYIQHSYCRLFNYEANTLLDYITNLEDTLIDKQECIDAYSEIINNRDEKIANLQQENKEWGMIFDTFSSRPYAHRYLEEKRKELGNKKIIGLDSEMIYKEYYNLKQIEQDHKETNATLMSELAKLEEENERLKFQLEYQQMISSKYRIRKNIYKSRCEKANTILNNIYMLDNVTITNNACEEIDKAINILQNGSEEK